MIEKIFFSSGSQHYKSDEQLMFLSILILKNQIFSL